MSCPRNTFGHPACFITSHPDYPQEKFCVTCRQRFYQHPLIYNPPADTSSKGIFFVIITVLMLVILFKVISEDSPNPRPVQLNHRDEYPHLMLRQS